MTVISRKCYLAIPEELRPPTKHTDIELSTVDGSPMTNHGAIDLRFKLGGITFQEEVMIADTTNDMILGLDFLQNKHRCGLTFYDNMIEIDGHRMKTKAIKTIKVAVCKVAVAEGTIIPSRSETFIMGRVKPRGGIPEQGLLEPARRSNAQRGLWAARSVVEVKDGKVPILVRNPLDEPIQLYKGQIAGILHPNPNCIELNTEPGNAETSAQTVQVNRVQGVTKQQQETRELPEHVHKLWQEGKENLSEDESQQLKEVLHTYQHLFVGPDTKWTTTDKIEHHIETGDHPPIKQRARRLPVHKQEVAKEEIETMLEDKVIRPSNSAWASPIVLVTKKDGTPRFCIDFRKLNDITVKDSFPLPRTDECLDTLAGSKWFCSFDLNRAYWQVPVAEKDKPKTAFADRSGLYEFNVMPYGLCNAAPTFERLMSTVLTGLQWHECLVFLDDLLVFGSNFSETLARMVHMFERLDDGGLRIKPSKTFLFKKELVFLGHVVSEEGVRTDPAKSQVIKDWPTPKSAKETLSFVQLCSYYRRFIKNFAEKARPLYGLDPKSFNWSPECDKAFNTLKEELTSPKLLAYPDLSSEFVLDTDASQWAIGGTLSQVCEGVERPVAYGSRTLNRAERRYSTTKRELLAVKHFMKHFHHYLWGSKSFVVRVVHNPLNDLLSKDDSKADMATLRWKDYINSYEGVKLVYREGKRHGNADALSRIPETDDDQAKLPEQSESSTRVQGARSARNQRSSDLRRKQKEKQKPRQKDSSRNSEVDNTTTDQFRVKTPEEIREMQLEDSEIGILLRCKEESDREPRWEEISAESRALKELWSQWDQLELVDGVLHRRFIDVVTGNNRLQLIVPKVLRTEMLRLHHNIRTSGHLGRNKTLARLRQRCYWPGMRKDVCEWLKQCDVCAKNKKPSKRPRAELHQYSVGATMERVAIDLVKLPETEGGNKYCLVASDYFSRFVHAVPIPDKESKTVAVALFDRFLSILGMPKELHSDQGGEFESQLFKELCDLLDISKSRTTAGNPKSDGLIERFNRTLISMLRAFAEEYPRNWDQYLPQVMMGYRATVQESLGMTPNYLMYGRECDLPPDLMYGLPPGEEPMEADAWVSEMRSRFEVAYQFVREHLKASQKRQKKLYDQKSWGEDYKPGELVWLSPLSRKKMDPYFTGPYIVKERLSRARYVIQFNIQGSQKAVHYDRLYPYKAANIPQWIQDVQSGATQQKQPVQQDGGQNPVVGRPAVESREAEDDEESAESITSDSEDVGHTPIVHT